MKPKMEIMLAAKTAHAARRRVREHPGIAVLEEEVQLALILGVILPHFPLRLQVVPRDLRHAMDRATIFEKSCPPRIPVSIIKFLTAICAYIQ